MRSAEDASKTGAGRGAGHDSPGGSTQLAAGAARGGRPRAAGRAPGPRRVGQGRHPPQGLRTAGSARRDARPASRPPRELELRHDYLWRVHQAVPPRGAIGIFNRSHYEDVLVVRVRRLVPESVVAAAVRADQSVRADSDRERHRDPQVHAAHLARGAAGAAAGAAGGSGEVLEVQRGRPEGAGAVGRLHRGVSGDAAADQHARGAVVRGAGGREAGPRRPGGSDGDGDTGAHGPAVSRPSAGAGGRCGRPWRS